MSVNQFIKIQKIKLPSVLRSQNVKDYKRKKCFK